MFKSGLRRKMIKKITSVKKAKAANKRRIKRIPKTKRVPH